MSLSISFEVEACPRCYRDAESIWSRDPTYNLRPMWEAAGVPFGEGVEGKRVVEILPDLHRALRALLDEPERFRAMNPSNGWGSYDGLVEVVRSALEAAERYPNARVRTRR